MFPKSTSAIKWINRGLLIHAPQKERGALRIATDQGDVARYRKSNDTRGRIPSIECFRVLAIFGVILWHTDLLDRLRIIGNGYWVVGLNLDLVWWLSVPYFFIVAGYFFRTSVLIHGDPISHLRRYVSSLGWIFIAWLCIYTVIPFNWPVAVRDHGWWQPFYSETLKNVNVLATQHVRLLLSPDLPIFHLWFFPALMFSLTGLTLMVVCRLHRYEIPLMVGLYLLALTEEVAGGHFLIVDFQIGLWSIALLFTLLGSWLVSREQTTLTTALVLIASGYALALIEGAILIKFFHGLPHKHLYLGGIFLPLGFVVLALAKPNLWQRTPLPFLAKFTLGVYVSHILLIYTFTAVRWRLQNLFPFLSPWWPFLFPFTVYFLAVLFTVAVSKVPITRDLVAIPRHWHGRDRSPRLITGLP